MPFQISMPPVEFAGDLLSVRFDRFDSPAYRRFLQVKSLPESTIQFDRDTEAYTVTAPKRFAAMLGEAVPDATASDLPLSAFLFDDQREIVETALDVKRFACWSDCGFGKTLISLEFARHVMHRTGRRVLIVTMNDIVSQFIDECQTFYGDSLPIERIASRSDLRKWCKGEGPALGVTNYEKFNPEQGSNDNQVITELRLLGGLILDESSRLKTGGGKQKWAIIKSSKGIEYKLSCTATPAPNDTMEFASQASFLERMRSNGDIIWTYFHRDSKTHRWTVKRHAREAFFKFMSSWSIYVRDPRRYGWRQDHQPVPEPIVKVEEINATPEQLEAMRHYQTDPNGQMRLYAKDETNAIERVKLSEIAKGFVYGEHKSVQRIPSLKPDRVAGIIADEQSAGAQVLVWTQFDAETDILAGILRDRGVPFEVVTGRVSRADREPIIQRFRSGETPVLIGRPKMLGYGQNFQCASAMVFSGWSDSFEEWYQAIRRAYRFGQTERLRVYVPVVRDLEGDMLDNVFAKQEKHLAAIDEMEANYIRARKQLRTTAC